MPCYFIAHINIHDEAEYRNYLQGTERVFRQYRGKYLAVDENAVIVEGSCAYTRTVLIEFESESDFREWYFSEAYQTILKYRLKAAHCDSMLVHGNS